MLVSSVSTSPADSFRRGVGLDNVNAYYSTTLKRDRLARLGAIPGFVFAEFDLSESAHVAELVASNRTECVVHLATQAGVRWSIENRKAYIDSNNVGLLLILEACRYHSGTNLIYAPSSSVYGVNEKLPFAVGDAVDDPISLNAVSKKVNELMAHTYSHLYPLPTNGLRFFMVCGAWGRPDMAMWKFTKAILAGEPISLYNHGKMRHDFTYVDDEAESILRLVERPLRPNPEWSGLGLEPPRAPPRGESTNSGIIPRWNYSMSSSYLSEALAAPPSGSTSKCRPRADDLCRCRCSRP